MASLSNLKKVAVLGGLHRIAVGDYEVTTAGSVTDVDTGLNTIEEAVAVVKGNATGATVPISVGVDFGTDDGLVDIYCFDAGGIIATGATVTVMVMAIGT